MLSYFYILVSLIHINYIVKNMIYYVVELLKIKLFGNISPKQNVYFLVHIKLWPSIVMIIYMNIENGIVMPFASEISLFGFLVGVKHSYDELNCSANSSITFESQSFW